MGSGDKTKKTDNPLQQAADAGPSAPGTNQFGHFVAVNSDFQVERQHLFSIGGFLLKTAALKRISYL